jgi:hypothetical protein
MQRRKVVSGAFSESLRLVKVNKVKDAARSGAERVKESNSFRVSTLRLSE